MGTRIKSLYCPCEGRSFPPDHYTSGACSNPPMPLAAIRSILLSEEADKFHAGGRITITRLLTCPREIAIADNCDIDGVDIRTFDSRRKGSVIHADLQAHAAKGYAELEFPQEGRPAPTLLGEPVSGRVDNVSADFSIIEDYKSHSELSYKMKGIPEGGPDNDTAQLNIIRVLIARGVLDIPPEGYRPKLVIWHTAQTSAGRPPWIPIEHPYMSEEEIGEFKPCRGDYTVTQILGYYRQFRFDMEMGVDLDVALRQIPLVGRGFKFGKKPNQKCLVYCTMKGYCDGLEGISGEVDW